jgi:NAD(P)-dependent dehydrogenase (short-subunit alcohol dehydrogenase family)
MMQPGRALITGAGKRLGREMALFLADLGWDIAVHYASSKDEAEALVREIRTMGREAQALQADLLDEAAAQSLIPRAAKALGGPLTLLINNASIFENDSLQSATRESWDRHIESNLRAPFVLIQNFAAQAPKAGTDKRGEPLARALVINMLDQRIRKLTPAFMSYTIAKMGLWALTQTAARAMAPDVRINGIGPGPTLQGARQSDAHFARQRAATVLERGSNPEDITAALGYFLNADGVTGQMICTDGGQHLGWQTPDILGQE